MRSKPGTRETLKSTKMTTVKIPSNGDMERTDHFLWLNKISSGGIGNHSEVCPTYEMCCGQGDTEIMVVAAPMTVQALDQWHPWQFLECSGVPNINLTSTFKIILEEFLVLTLGLQESNTCYSYSSIPHGSCRILLWVKFAVITSTQIRMSQDVVVHCKMENINCVLRMATLLASSWLKLQWLKYSFKWETLSNKELSNFTE